MLIQIWEDDLGVECSVAAGSQCKKHQLSYLAEVFGFKENEHLKLLHQFDADTWFEAMTIYNEFMGHGPYHPPILENGEVDPVVFEPLAKRHKF